MGCGGSKNRIAPAQSEDEVKQHIRESIRSIVSLTDLRGAAGPYIMDKYGFLVKCKDLETATAEAELEAEMELLSISAWDGILEAPEPKTLWTMDFHRLRSLIFAGLPVAVRCRLWRYCFGVDQFKELNHGVFADAAERELPSEHQIAVDLNRTFPNHPYFRSAEGKAKLKRVLNAFAVLYPSVGYVQGMNFLVAIFLLHTEEEEDAFWMLVSYMTWFQMMDFYQPGLALLSKTLGVLNSGVAAALPRLSGSLQAQNVDSFMYATPWFITSYSYSLPAHAVSTLWDLFLITSIGSISSKFVGRDVENIVPTVPETHEQNDASATASPLSPIRRIDIAPAPVRNAAENDGENGIATVRIPNPPEAFRTFAADSCTWEDCTLRFALAYMEFMGETHKTVDTLETMKLLQETRLSRVELRQVCQRGFDLDLHKLRSWADTHKPVERSGVDGLPSLRG